MALGKAFILESTAGCRPKGSVWPEAQRREAMCSVWAAGRDLVLPKGEMEEGEGRRRAP